MSNQLLITGGAKVRNLQGVITGTSGVLSSVPLGAANGVATLDSSGKVPVSQLPSSVVTYLGTWDASTNTPTLTNGTGDAGDMYICNVAGTVNFGAGPITFSVGDWVLYGSGTWQKSNGQNGTVTSVGLSNSGNALSISNSPVTTAGVINIGFAGNSGQYINGAGNLTTFPSIITEAQKLITEVYNETGATLSKGTVVYINGGHGNLPTVTKALATSDATSAQTYGVVQSDITNNNNGYVVVIGTLSDLDTQSYANGTQLYLSSTTAGDWTSTKPSAPIHLVYVGIVVRSHPTQGVVEIRIQNGYELEELHDVAISAPVNNQGIFYNSSTDLWENKSIATVLGYTPLSGGGTAGNIPYYTGTYTLGSENGFMYDSSTNRLGVNTTVPNATIGANASIDSGYSLLLKNADANYNGIGFGINTTYGNTFETQKLGVANAMNLTLLNQSGYISLTEGGNLGINILSPIASPSGVGSKGIDIYGDSQAASIGFHNAASGTGNTNGAYLYLTNTGTFTLRNLEGGIGTSSLGDFSIITNSTENFRVNSSNGTIWQSNISDAMLKTVSGVLTAAVAGTDYVAPSALSGYVPTSRTISINGTTQDLSSNRSWSVGTLTGGGAAGRVAFWDGASNVVSDSIFVWDDTNNRLGIGLTNPQRALEIYSATADTHLRLSGSAPSVSMGEAITGSVYQAKFGLATASNQFVTGSVAGDFVINNQTGSTIWAYNSTEKMRLDTSGNLGIGGTARNGYRLHVYDTAPMLGIESTTTGNVYLRMLQAGTVVSGAYYNNSDTTFRIFNNNGGLRFDTSTINGVITVLSAGNIGFNTLTPSDYIDGESGMAYVQSTNGRAVLSLVGTRTAADEALGRISFTNTNATTAGSKRLAYISGVRGTTNNSAYLEFAVANDAIGTPKMWLSQTGNLGIGTSSPGATLDVQTSSGVGSSTASGLARFITAGTTPAISVGQSNSARRLNIYSYLISVSGEDLALQTEGSTAVTFNTNSTERMRITSSGLIGIGTSSPSASYRLTVYNSGNGGICGTADGAGDAQFLSSSTGIGYHFYGLSGSAKFYVVNGGQIYSTSTSISAISDARHKENIRPIETGLNEIMSLQPSRFDWKEGKGTGKKNVAGFIAQDIEAIFPDLVDEWKETMDATETFKSIRMTDLIPTLVKAIQEQQVQIEELKQLINK